MKHVCSVEFSNVILFRVHFHLQTSYGCNTLHAAWHSRIGLLNNSRNWLTFGNDSVTAHIVCIDNDNPFNAWQHRKFHLKGNNDWAKSHVPTQK